MGNGVEFRVMPNDEDGRWYWEVIKDGREVVARGIADTESAACQQAGEAARALRERAVAITVGSSSTGLWPTIPRPPALPVAMVAAGELPPITIVELGFPPAAPCAR